MTLSKKPSKSDHPLIGSKLVREAGIIVRVYKQGGSFGVLIPKDFAHLLGFAPDMRFRLMPCGDELVLSRADKPSSVAKALAMLFRERTE